MNFTRNTTCLETLNALDKSPHDFINALYDFMLEYSEFYPDFQDLGEETMTAVFGDGTVEFNEIARNVPVDDNGYVVVEFTFRNKKKTLHESRQLILQGYYSSYDGFESRSGWKIAVPYEVTTTVWKPINE